MNAREISVLKSAKSLYDVFSGEIKENIQNFNSFDEIVGSDLVNVYTYLVNEAINVLLGKKLTHNIPENVLEQIEEKFMTYMGYLAKYIEESNSYNLNTLMSYIYALAQINESEKVEPVTLEFIRENLKSAAKVVEGIYKELEKDTNLNQLFENVENPIKDIPAELKGQILATFMLESFLSIIAIRDLLLEGCKRRKKKKSDKSEELKENEEPNLDLELVERALDFGETVFKSLSKYTIE